MNKRIAAIILARKGSKGLKNKNIRRLRKELIFWPINAAIKSKYEDVFVSTDCQKY